MRDQQVMLDGSGRDSHEPVGPTAFVTVKSVRSAFRVYVEGGNKEGQELKDRIICAKLDI